MKRLLRRWRALGDAGLVSRQRGRPSPRRLEASKRARIEELLRDKYPDFGATLAAEKLGEREGVEVSRETVRRIQIDWVWRASAGAGPRAFIDRASVGRAWAN